MGLSMRHVFACVALVLAVSIAAVPLSRAADKDDASSDTVRVTLLPGAGDTVSNLPAVRELDCEITCSDIVEPQYQSSPLPIDGITPTDSDRAADAHVEIQYVIKADGHLSDVAVSHLVGPPAFADWAVAREKGRLFKPALFVYSELI